VPLFVLADITLQNGPQSGFSESGGLVGSQAEDTTFYKADLKNATAGVGGLVYTQGALTFTAQDSSFTNGQIDQNLSPGGDGGGLYLLSGAITIDRSLIGGNSSADSGGGMAMGTGPTVIRNSIFTANTARRFGGGIWAGGGGSLTITGSTLTGNTSDSNNLGAETGGALFQPSGAATLRNSILSANVIGSGASPTSSHCAGAATFTLSSANLLDTAGGCDTTPVQTIVNPATALTAWTLAGGSFATVRPLLSSPAIDAGDQALCDASPLQLDARRGARTFGSEGCDLGAVEAGTFVDLQSSTPTIEAREPYSSSATVTTVLSNPTLDYATGATLSLALGGGATFVSVTTPAGACSLGLNATTAACSPPDNGGRDRALETGSSLAVTAIINLPAAGSYTVSTSASNAGQDQNTANDQASATIVRTETPPISDTQDPEPVLPKARIVGTRFTVKRGRVALKVTCPAGVRDSCVSTITSTSRLRFGQRAKKTRLTFKCPSVKVPAGSTKNVTCSVGKRVVLAMRSRKTIAMTAVVSSRDASNQPARTSHAYSLRR
jgi:hypothetical protein